MLFGSEFLDIVIGLIMIYLLLSLLVSSLNELILSVFTSKRGEVLHTAVRTMLSDGFDPAKSSKKQQKEDEANKASAEGIGDLGVKFYEHPLLLKFAKNKPKLKKGEQLNRPSYLHKANFSKILLDLLDDPEALDRSFNTLATRIKERVPEGATRTALLTFVKEAQGDVNKLDALLQQWYDDMMQRASGWYKRHVQKMLLILGLVVSVAVDADTFSIADKLANDPEARQQMVNLANNYIDSQVKADTSASVNTNSTPEVRDSANQSLSATATSAPKKPSEKTQARIDSIQGVVHELVTDELYEARAIMGMGWELPAFPKSDGTGKGAKSGETGKMQKWKTYLFTSASMIWSQISVQKLLGWFVTALAITLGAPFWFDLLKRVINIRNTGNKPEDNSVKSNT